MIPLYSQGWEYCTTSRTAKFHLSCYLWYFDYLASSLVLRRILRPPCLGSITIVSAISWDWTWRDITDVLAIPTLYHVATQLIVSRKYTIYRDTWRWGHKQELVLGCKLQAITKGVKQIAVALYRFKSIFLTMVMPLPVKRNMDYKQHCPWVNLLIC